MLINQISADECEKVLARSTMGRLGCSLNDQPYVVPVFLAYEPGYVYIFSTLGQKIEWMRTNPRVCIEVDEIANEFQWLSVIVSGTYEELGRPKYEEEYARARTLLSRRHHWWKNAFAERQLKQSDGLIDPLLFRVSVDSVTGLRATSEQTDVPAA